MSNFVCGVGNEVGQVSTEKSPTNAKVSPRLLSFMVETFKSFLFSILTLKTVFLRQTLRLWRVAGSGKIPHFV